MQPHEHLLPHQTEVSTHLLLSNQLDIGGGITSPIVVERLKRRIGPDVALIATVVALHNKCLVVTNNSLYLCNDVQDTDPLIQQIPFESITLLTTNLHMGAPSLSWVTTRGAETTLRVQSHESIKLEELTAILRIKMIEQPAPPSSQLQKIEGATVEEEEEGSSVGNFLFGAGRAVSETTALLGAGLMLAGGLIDLVSPTEVTVPGTEQERSQPASEPLLLRSERLDIGGGIHMPKTIAALQNVFAEGETLLATMQGVTGAALVMTSKRLIVAEERGEGEVTLREVQFDQVDRLETYLDSDPCTLIIVPKQCARLSIQVSHECYNQLNELATRLRTRIKQTASLRSTDG